MFIRTDLSDKLIHFVRAVNRESNDYMLSEMHSYEFAFGELVEEDKISPFFILRRIIRKLQVLSTWSYRNGSSTIRGNYPVTCFTDMPISAFVATSIDRLSKGQKISNYALVFDKKQMFAIGARPVIYGATKNEALPETEKYRFVAYDPTSLPYAIDWTHEREWRWANFDYISKMIPQQDFSDEDHPLEEYTLELMRLRDEERIEFHGLNLDKQPLSNIGFILKTKEQARLILRDILWLIDQGKISANLFTYILFFSDLQANPDSIQDPKFINDLISNGRIEIAPYLIIDKHKQREVIAKLAELSSSLMERFNPDEFPGGITGISFPCFNDNLSQAARLLVGTAYVKITKLGRYLLNLPCLNQTQSLELNEQFVIDIVNPQLSNILETPLTYYSVGSLSRAPISQIGLNDIPFYTEPNDDEWNEAHREEDF
ncbi:hypothetical protein ABDD95_07635 [Mucilaginibacter sp. PAMB04274]|uniref:hypothetical protein n=1 Tax=Mucilaginibacter sp. PAMB04274 TaxID=3138568 RepID=UPI0031F644DE